MTQANGADVAVSTERVFSTSPRAVLAGEGV